MNQHLELAAEEASFDQPPVPAKTPVWYLLQCKARQQARAEEHLQNQGFAIYSPVHRVKRVRRGQYETRLESVFPGYVFIELTDNSNWRALYGTRGVSRLVSFNGRPHPVESGLVGALKSRFMAQTEPQALYAPGQRVVITEGCFRHLEAIVQAVTADERIIVLMNIMHSQQALAMDAAQLTRVG